MTIEEEIKQADDKYGNFNSTHEVYGVLKEEVDEFWELVKFSNSKVPGNINNLSVKTKRRKMISELTQIAAIAQRAITQLKEDKIKFV